MALNFRAQYEALAGTGAIERDPMQERIVTRLARLEERLEQSRLARKSSSLGWLFGGGAADKESVKGLYIFGDVGRGKTMLMDLFFTSSAIERKRRVHFHEFMSDVHDRVHAYRQKLRTGDVKGDDPIAPVAAELADEAWLLCFDEFHVTDIADAMILGRLFARLFALGVVVVATSNVAPDDLYKGGLNRSLFLPFIALIERYMEVVRLDARTDYRLEKLGDVPVYYVPADATAKAALDQAWRRLTGGAAGREEELVIKGHHVRVPLAARGVARFTFHELCGEPLGSADYLRISQAFHTLIVEDIPVMNFDRRNEAKRFINLIDTLYDRAVKLLASAAAPPADLYSAESGFEVQEFHRTASRLSEMQSQSYLALPHGRSDSAASGSTEGLVET